MFIVRCIHERPSIEDSVPSKAFQSSFPEGALPSDSEDKQVIYGGGFFRLTFITKDFEIQGVQSTVFSGCFVYVLNTYLVLWFESERFGLRIPYQLVLLTALQTDPEGIYLQIEPRGDLTASPESTLASGSNSGLVELKITQFDGVHSDPLLNQFPNSINQTYEAIAQCSSFHEDLSSDTEDDREDNNLLQKDDFTTDLTNGEADDLGLLSHPPAQGKSASMAVNILGQVVGIRARDDDESDQDGVHYINKKTHIH
ncbi:BA75_00443T0 [Komagataella pastoris]|uniref:Protein LOT5 n=1 Tax=Komagataella pastoris TaxID=4922 RepID=A0A1B2J6C6_PICPA|nr:BA75_00443T0 [Komagataella pastoris]